MIWWKQRLDSEETEAQTAATNSKLGCGFPHNEQCKRQEEGPLDNHHNHELEPPLSNNAGTHYSTMQHNNI